MSFSIFINDPFFERVPPVLDEKSFGVFLTLAVTEPSLRLRPRNQMISHQIYFQEFPDIAADLSLRTPSPAIYFLSNPTNNKILFQLGLI